MRAILEAVRIWNRVIYPNFSIRIGIGQKFSEFRDFHIFGSFHSVG